GDKIATMVNERRVNHQTGTDGVTYAYEHGQWSRTQHHVQLEGVSSANPYNAPNYTSTTTFAPPEQLSQLDYQRMTAITALALANPATQDTRRIDLDGTKWHATREGWAQQVEMPGVPNSFGIPSVITVDKAAGARTGEQLNQIAANRQFNNEHYAADVSKAYVMDYYGNGWSANGPLPDVVTTALDLPSEQHIRDPVTGRVWNVTPWGHFSREVALPLDKMVIRETVQASGEELNRLSDLKHSAVESNAAYGKRLIAHEFEEWHAARQSGLGGPAAAPLAARHATSGSVTAAPSRASAPITPSSSHREMFDALVSAARRMDIDAMRSVSQAYMQSDRGQAWLAQGQQFNQQQALARQQATLAAQQQAEAQQLAAFTAALEQRGDHVVRQTHEAAQRINEVARTAVASSERMTADAIEQFRRAAADAVGEGLRRPLEDAGRTMRSGTQTIQATTNELEARVRTLGKTLTAHA